jgi:opacity protein-like surface antigen
MKKNVLAVALALMASIGAYAEKNTISSPDGKLNVVVEDHDGKLYYSIDYAGKRMMEESQLGLLANVGDFSQGLTYQGKNEIKVEKSDSEHVKEIKGALEQKGFHLWIV